ncbi:MAG: hypothetical protein RTV31_17365, partial [Candidatus Thorarchaeota archaeon]
MHIIGKAQKRQAKTIKSVTVSIIAISLCLSGCSVFVDPVDATILLVYQNNNGAIFHNGTSLQMPGVNVSSIYIQETGSLTITYEYEISTNTTQNVTLAIVYPSWNAGSYTHFNTTAEIAITLNSTPIDFRTLSWTQLGWNSSDYDEFNFETDWFFDALYAVLDLSLLQNTTSILKVNIQDEARNVDFFEMNHFVGSIRTLDSDSHLRIHFDVIDEDNLLGSSEFEPASFRTTRTYNETTEAIWDFNMSEIEFDTVRINLNFNIYHAPDSWPIYFFTSMVGQILSIVAVIVILIAIV